jgi:hypothetical protein
MGLHFFVHLGLVYELLVCIYDIPICLNLVNEEALEVRETVSCWRCWCTIAFLRATRFVQS